MMLLLCNLTKGDKQYNELLKPFILEVDQTVQVYQFKTDFILLFHEIDNVSRLIDELLAHIIGYIEELKRVYEDFWKEGNIHLETLKKTQIILSNNV